jgi:hypothetical protein
MDRNSYGYASLLRAGWETGVHDCRGLRYEHPWVAVSQEHRVARGCWSREEARNVLWLLEQGIHPDQLSAP